MTSQTVEIRLKLLRDIGLGLTKAETVKQLTDKFGITRSGAYYHFETKDKWLKDYGDFSNARELQFNILQQFSHINREASFQYLTAADPNTKIGFLRVRLDALGKLAEYGLPADLKPPLPKTVFIADWKNKSEQITDLLQEYKDIVGYEDAITEEAGRIQNEQLLNRANYSTEEQAILDQACRIIDARRNTDHKETLH